MLKQCRRFDIIVLIQIVLTLFHFIWRRILLNNVAATINSMNIKERSDGRFEGRITVDGNRKSFYGKTKADVKNKAKEYLLKVENGYKDPKKILFEDYALYWLRTYKWNKVEPTSYTRLYRIYEAQIVGGIGRKKIGDITTKDIQALIDGRANPTDENVRALSMSGLKRLFKFIKACMYAAMEEEIIYKNPCDYVILPKESCIKVATKKQFSLNDNEISQIKEASFKKYVTTGEYCSRDFFVILLVLNLGLRLGEVLSLKWEDIDFDKRIVHINKTMQTNILDFDAKDGDRPTYNRIKNMPKTRAGIRTLGLNEDVISYLTELQKYDKRNNIYSEYVCCMRNGEISNARNLTKSLKRLLKKANIDKPVTMHTLRHTFGSVMIRRGVSIEVVSKLMGHSNVATTYGIYIHSIQEEEAKAMTTIRVC